MRYIIQPHKEKKQFFMEVPDTLSIADLAIGEKFVLSLSPDQGKTFTHYEACFLAGKSALLIENKVYRFSEKIKKIEDGFALFQGKYNYLNNFFASPFHPVEPKKRENHAKGGEIKSPMTGKVVTLPVASGAVVKRGDVLAVVEAMKMENAIRAEIDGTVQNVRVAAGNNVTVGDILLTLEAAQTVVKD